MDIGSKPTKQPEENYVDGKEVASFLGVSVGHVRKMAEKGLIPGKPIGLGSKHYWRFLMSEVNEALNQQNK